MVSNVRTIMAESNQLMLFCVWHIQVSQSVWALSVYYLLATLKSLSSFVCLKHWQALCCPEPWNDFAAPAWEWMERPVTRKFRVKARACCTRVWLVRWEEGEVKVEPAILLCHCFNTMEFFFFRKGRLILHVCSHKVCSNRVEVNEL